MLVSYTVSEESQRLKKEEFSMCSAEPFFHRLTWQKLVGFYVDIVTTLGEKKGEKLKKIVMTITKMLVPDTKCSFFKYQWALMSALSQHNEKRKVKKLRKMSFYNH